MGRGIRSSILVVVGLLYLVGCQNTSENPIADIKKESELVKEIDKAKLSKKSTEQIEALEKLLRFYPNSKQYKTHFIQLIELQYLAGEYQQAREKASEYMARFPADKNADRVSLWWLKSIAKLTKSSWLGGYLHRQGDVVSQELLEEGVLVSEQMLAGGKSRYAKEAKSYQQKLKQKLAARHYAIAAFYAQKKAYLASQQRLKQCLHWASDDAHLKKQAQNLWLANSQAMGLD